MAKGGWELVMLGQGPQGEAIVNTSHYVSDVDEALNPDLGVILAEQFKIVFGQILVQCVTEDYTGFQISARCLFGPNLDQEHTIPAGELVGDLAGPSAPLQTCAIIRRKSSAIGKHGRGRVFVSPIPRTWVDVNGRLDDGGVVLPLLGDAVKADLVTLEGTYHPCLHNKNAGGIVGLTIITHTQLSQIAGVMRSRRLRFPN